MAFRYLLFAAQAYAYEILRPLQAAARLRGDEVAWFLEPSAGNALRTDETQLMDADAVARFNPDAVFVPGNIVPDFFPGVKVQVFHGFGIEKKGHFRIRGWFDLYCTHGPLTTEPFEALARRQGHFAVRETGWPKMDLLFERSVKNWREEFAEPEKPLVLYAPTFSPSLTSAPALFRQIEKLASHGEWNWLIKFHPKMERDWVRRFEGIEGEQLRIVRTPDIVGLLQAADVLLSDTSSVIAEFLLLDKPAVTLHNSRPGAHLINFTEPGELQHHLQLALASHAAERNAARAFANAMHPYTDGKSSERVLDAVEQFIRNGDSARLKPKPLNLWRRFRTRLKYRRLRRLQASAQ